MSCLAAQYLRRCFLLLYGGTRCNRRSLLLLTLDIPCVAAAAAREGGDILGATVAFARDSPPPAPHPQRLAGFPLTREERAIHCETQYVLSPFSSCAALYLEAHDVAERETCLSNRDSGLYPTFSINSTITFDFVTSWW